MDASLFIMKNLSRNTLQSGLNLLYIIKQYKQHHLCCNVSECIYTYAHTVYNNRFREGCIYVSHTHFFHCLKIYNGTTSC